MSVQPVILFGGAGRRLSRTRLLKQFLSFGGHESLLQATFERVREFTEANAPTIICNDEYRFLVADHMQAIGLPFHTIMLEPMGRNTAPAIPMAALHALENDPIRLVLPSDHLLKDPAAFGEAVHKASEHYEHQRVYRPLGFYESVSECERFQVKHTQVKPGAAIPCRNVTIAQSTGWWCPGLPE